MPQAAPARCLACLQRQEPSVDDRQNRSLPMPEALPPKKGKTGLPSLKIPSLACLPASCEKHDGVLCCQSRPSAAPPADGAGLDQPASSGQPATTVPANTLRFGNKTEVDQSDRNERTIAATQHALRLFKTWCCEKQYPEEEHDPANLNNELLAERLQCFILQVSLLLLVRAHQARSETAGPCCSMCLCCRCRKALTTKAIPCCTRGELSETTVTAYNVTSSGAQKIIS